MPFRPWTVILLAGCGAAPAASAPNDVTPIVIGPVASASSARPSLPPQPPGPNGHVAMPQVEAFAKEFRRELLFRVGSTNDPAFATFREANLSESDAHLDDARKRYFEVISQFPQSSLVPYAYLAFADIFFDEADADPSKLSLAKQAYEKVVVYPLPENLAYGYAWERLGETATRSSDFARAMVAARKAIEVSTQSPTLPIAERVAESARHTLVAAYAVSGNPASAPAFFRATDAANASALVVALGEAYVKTASASQLADLYDAALATKDEVVCAGAAQIRDGFHPPGAPAIVAITRIESKRRAACGP